jgi:broad specificity phosphatase PhoE
LSNVYLIRHGQAGTRENYDTLSPLGRRQSRLLGEHLVSQGIGFAAAYTGAMLRQQESAAEVRQAYARARLPFPEIQADEGWNEFDLARLYRELAPRLAAENAVFRRQHAEFLRQAAQSAGAPDAPIHRQWQPCDTTLVEAWIDGRFPYEGESWPQFCERVGGCRHKVCALNGQQSVLVFTSAVPVAIWAGLSLAISDLRIMRLAGVLYNTAYSIVRSSGDDLRLLAFNAIPHLAGADLRTRR